MQRRETEDERQTKNEQWKNNGDGFLWLDRIYQGDCFELLKRIPDESIDLVLTDPPYGTTENKWDVKIDTGLLMKELLRIAKKNAAILIFSQMPFSVDVVNAARKWFRYEWVLEKNNATGFLNARRMPLKAHENLLVFYKALPKYNPQMVQGSPYSGNRHNAGSNYKANEILSRNNDGTRFPRDVYRVLWKTFGRGSDDGKTLHPTQKPTNLCEYFIRTYSDEGDVVLDPFLGSGTVAVAAKKLGRHYIGMEKEPEYFQTALQRLEAVGSTENARHEPQEEADGQLSFF